jgi:hypothetical protein
MNRRLLSSVSTAVWAATLFMMIPLAALGQRYSFCATCTTAETISRRFAPPTGFSRAAVPPGSYEEWLRSIPLLPSSSDALDWTGHVALPADMLSGVLDWRLLGRVEQCADIALRLVAEYSRLKKEDDLIAFRSLSGQIITWSKWRHGRYAITTNGSAITYHSGAGEQDTPGAFDDFLRFVMTYANTASIRRDWPVADTSDLRIGDVLVQPGCPGTGLGHLSIIVDKCENVSGDQIYLFIDGFTPARMPVVRQRLPEKPESVWMSPRKYQEYQIQFGWGTFHRFPGWESAANQ